MLRTQTPPKGPACWAFLRKANRGQTLCCHPAALAAVCLHGHCVLGQHPDACSVFGRQSDAPGVLGRQSDAPGVLGRQSAIPWVVGQDRHAPRLKAGEMSPENASDVQMLPDNHPASTHCPATPSAPEQSHLKRGRGTDVHASFGNFFFAHRQTPRHQRSKPQDCTRASCAYRHQTK